MRLNYECIRDILIYIADNQHYQFDNHDRFHLRTISRAEIMQADGISNVYNTEDVLYSIEALKANEYIQTWSPTGGPSNRHGMLDVLDITPAGHEFLDTFKEPTMWQAAKTRVENTVGGKTLSVLMSAGRYLANLAITDPEAFSRCMSVLGI